VVREVVVGIKVRPPSSGAVIGSLALVVALSGTAYAATASLVSIKGAGSKHEVKVTKSGQLAVDAGKQTAAGQLLTASANPAAMVHAQVLDRCNSTGNYVVPKGKALVVTAATFFEQHSTGGYGELDLYVGTAKSPCNDFVGAAAGDSDLSQNQSFGAGLVVPAGGAMAAVDNNVTGSVEIYGYLMPASEAPKPKPVTADGKQITGRTPAIPSVR
jgi:hypothetical protein